MIFTDCYEGKHRKCPGHLSVIMPNNVALRDTAGCSCECHPKKEVNTGTEQEDEEE